MKTSENNTIVLSTSYFGPVQWYSKFLGHDVVIIEKAENYSRQSFRNRCDIYSANGKITLSVPVVKGSSKDKKKIHEIEIDYSENWQKNHLKAIESAYRNSPFFAFFIDDIVAVLVKQYQFLWDLNLNIIHVVMSHLELENQPGFTTEFHDNFDNANDYRSGIHPKKRLKKPDKLFLPKKYKQVFDEKHGFIPNLSILDLLFNEGPNAHEILRQSALIA